MSRKVKPAGGMLAVAAFAMALCPAAFAGDITGADVTVRYSDLDISTAAGAAQLLRRIEVAADRVCAPLDHGTLASRTKRDSCEHRLTSAAVTKVNHPMLAEVYRTARRQVPAVAALMR